MIKDEKLNANLSLDELIYQNKHYIINEIVSLGI
jgi:hypothetical protein